MKTEEKLIKKEKIFKKIYKIGIIFFAISIVVLTIIALLPTDIFKPIIDFYISIFHKNFESLSFNSVIDSDGEIIIQIKGYLVDYEHYKWRIVDYIFLILIFLFHPLFFLNLALDDIKEKIKDYELLKDNKSASSLNKRYKRGPRFIKCHFNVEVKD
jgi:hypothetical protein